MPEFSPAEFFQNARTDKTYVSSAFPDLHGRSLRIANKVFDADEKGLYFALVKDELILRQTPAQRFQIKATFLEDDREFQSLTIQKFTSSGQAREYFSFRPNEILSLLSFLSNLKKLHFTDAGKVNVKDADLEDLLLRPDQAKRIVADNPELIAALARTEVTTEDIIALGYRKEQLKIFDQLLNDPDFFSAQEQKQGTGPEGIWQTFFESNPWIFGYSLSMIHFGPLNGRKLEQTVRGRDLNGPGKRVDALLRSNAIISTVAFVEIKHHRTDLLKETSYRSGVWQPSNELTGAIAQIQGTVAAALEQWSPVEYVRNSESDLTGEVLHTAEPRCFVVCGRLSEFASEHGVNARKFRSFELCRRNLVRPEIVTFDELFTRASLIIRAGEESTII